jgi:biopolymer transport protein ExbD
MPGKTIRKNEYRQMRKGPVGEMNVTPFIDVLPVLVLVLLIAMILAIPVKPHQVMANLPTAGCLDCTLDPVTSTLFIGASGQLFRQAMTQPPARLLC